MWRDLWYGSHEEGGDYFVSVSSGAQVDLCPFRTKRHQWSVEWKNKILREIGLAHTHAKTCDP
jgi:hypothetical protein